MKLTLTLVAVAAVLLTLSSCEGKSLGKQRERINGHRYKRAGGSNPGGGDGDILVTNPFGSEEDSDTIIMHKGIVVSQHHKALHNDHQSGGGVPMQNSDEERPPPGVQGGRKKRDSNDPPREDITSINEGLQQKSARRKRFVTNNPPQFWTNATVPYKIDASVVDVESINIAMTRYHRYSCLRFVPWTSTVKTDYGLDHDGWVKFIKDTGCYASIGNTKNAAGQTCSCCVEPTCVHELGHTLGAYHEQRSEINSDHVDILWQGIQPSFRKYYGSYVDDNVYIDGYDTESLMSYNDVTFSQNGMKTMHLMLRENHFGKNLFYLLKEISTTHNCKDLRCASFSDTCVNDGFVSLVEDTCTCLCPYGLDPNTNCANVLQSMPAPLEWPAGNYGVEGGSSGCPGAAGEFQEGWVKQVTSWSSGIVSFASEMQSSFTSLEADQHFCIMDKPTPSGNEAVWGPGKYCIFKAGGACPNGFQEGFVKFNPISYTFSDPKPDGVYDTSVKLEFCCRHDGHENDPLHLPNDKPFVLFQNKKWSGCQTVAGMNIKTTNWNIKYEDGTQAGYGGEHPRVWQGYDRIYMYPCIYQPVDMNCGGVYDLDDNNPTAVIQSPNYPSNYAANTECHWLVKAPADHNIIVNFDDFEVEEVSGNCRDSLEMRFDRLAQEGITLCGDGVEQSYVTVDNTVMFSFRTDSYTQWKGFKATVSLIKHDDLCYSQSDKGRSYRGTVSVTRDNDFCLNWKDVPNCKVNFWNQQPEDGLEANYCRNPTMNLRPWCYTSTDCKRAYCDVCGLENHFDTAQDCATQAASGLCQNDPTTALANCAKTCEADLPFPTSVTKVSDITCSPPGSVPDGTMVSTPKSLYDVGDVVEYSCGNAYSEEYNIKRLCTTSGQWTPASTACNVCPAGWTFYKNKCYKYFAQRLRSDQSKTACNNLDAELATFPASEDLNFLNHLRPHATPVHVGLTDIGTEGVWVWPDGSAVNNVPWKPGKPDNYYNSDCAVLLGEDSGSQVTDIYCNYYNLNPYICERPVGGCPLGWSLFEGNCYKYHTEVLLFAAAEAACQAENALLLMLKTTEQLNFANTLRPYGQNILLGLFDRTVEGQWVWADGTPATNVNWYAGEPNNYYNQDCGQLLGQNYYNQIRDVYCAYYSQSPFICQKPASGCPSGWSYHEGNCFKHYSNAKLHDAASTECANDGAVLAMPKNAAVLAFINTLRGDSETIHIGMTDKTTEGTWVWADGTPVANNLNWETSEPDNSGDQDCTTMAGSASGNTLKDVDCQSTANHASVCQKPADLPGYCSDAMSNCNDLLTSDPSYCTQQSTFAYNFCRSTCGMC